jgi:hypothetical protein
MTPIIDLHMISADLYLFQSDHTAFVCGTHTVRVCVPHTHTHTHTHAHAHAQTHEDLGESRDTQPREGRQKMRAWPQALT